MAENQPPPKKKRFLRYVALIIFIFFVSIFFKPASHLINTTIHDVDGRQPDKPGFVNDASRLNETEVAEIIPIPSDHEKAIEQLQQLIKRARKNKQPISIAGARHSMGGHTMTKDGLVLNMLPFKEMSIDTNKKILTVQSGALWSDILPFLNKHNFSVAIMQSNNSFSVGGTLSVNAHGWQHDQAPVASTVISFTLLKADGQLVNCSRTENSELFKLVLGGYGLFGVIMEAQLKVVPNMVYESKRYIMHSHTYVDTYHKLVTDNKNVGMAFGRLSVVPKNFLNEAVLTIFLKTNKDSRVMKLEDPNLKELKRTVFRGSVGSDYGKEFRWTAEKQLGESVGSEFFSRNQLLNEGVEIYENRSKYSTDILHEYFVPYENFNAFIEELRKLVPKHKADLLNVTVRNVCKDNDSFLNFAQKDCLALVMLFDQKFGAAAETQMQNFTRATIDTVIRLGGCYYLPYRLHATSKQFHQAYPQAKEFLKLKKEYDPSEIFQNKFYQQYK